MVNLVDEDYENLRHPYLGNNNDSIDGAQLIRKDYEEKVIRKLFLSLQFKHRCVTVTGRWAILVAFYYMHLR